MNDTTAPQLVYLVRHGRTHLNAEGRLRGRADPELDDAGRHEVARTADALAGCGAAGVVTSPLTRAVQTAVAIEGRLHVKHVVDPRLADRDYGPQTGRTEAEVVAEFGSLDAAPGVEPGADLAARAMAALREAAARFAPAPVAVVSHDAVIRCLLRQIDPEVDPAVPTACWQLLELRDGRWSIAQLDCTAEEAAGRE